MHIIAVVETWWAPEVRKERENDTIN